MGCKIRVQKFIGRRQTFALYVLLFIACLLLYIKFTSTKSRTMRNKRDVDSRLQAYLKVQESDSVLPFKTKHIKYCEDIFPYKNAEKQMMGEFDDAWEQVRKNVDYVDALRLSLKHVKGTCSHGYIADYPEQMTAIAKLIE